MNALDIIVRIKKVSEDMVKEAFIIKAIREGVISSLTTEDIIELYPYNAYDYRSDGKNLDYIITEDSVALLADLSKINNWIVENVKYMDFNDCLSISNSEGNLIITCKDEEISGGERVMYMDKLLLLRRGIEIKVRPENPEKILSLEKYFENPMNIAIDSLVALPIYFVINPAKIDLDIIADAYINLLNKELNRVPTSTDIAEYLISIGRLDDNYIRAYVMRSDLESLRDYVDVGVKERGDEVIFSINNVDTISTLKMQSNQFLKIKWIDPQNLRVNGIAVNLIDMGGINILDCSSLLIDRMKTQLSGVIKW